MIGHIVTGVIYIFFEIQKILVEYFFRKIDFVLNRLFFIIITEIDLQILKKKFQSVNFENIINIYLKKLNCSGSKSLGFR